jgi:hypothetical protein
VELVENFKVHTHAHSCKECATAPLPPQEVEKVWHESYSTVESVLTGCITVWYGNTTALDRVVLQNVVRTAQYIIGAELPDIQYIISGGVKGRPGKSIETPATQAMDCSLW